MIYLERFRFGDCSVKSLEAEKELKLGGKRMLENPYPYNVMEEKGLESLDFAPITILYGGNGSGKSTILNIIANRLRIKRKTPYNITGFMKDFVEFCDYEIDSMWLLDSFFDEIDDEQAELEISKISKIISSDDIFKSMFDKRLKDRKDIQQTQKYLNRYLELRGSTAPPPKNLKINIETGEGLEELRDEVGIRKKSASRFLDDKLGKLEPNFSNGETALQYLFDEISSEGGLYLLDEPENSMSCKFQLQLAEFLEVSVKLQSQFIIATHSPFLLAIPNAKIYNLDENPVAIQPWNELENMKIYFDFFDKHKNDFY